MPPLSKFANACLPYWEGVVKHPNENYKITAVAPRFSLTPIEHGEVASGNPSIQLRILRNVHVEVGHGYDLIFLSLCEEQEGFSKKGAAVSCHTSRLDILHRILQKPF